MGRGHPNASDYTPRQLSAFVAYYERERKRELVEKVRVGRMINVTDEKGSKKVEGLLNKLERELDQ